MWGYYSCSKCGAREYMKLPLFEEPLCFVCWKKINRPTSLADKRKEKQREIITDKLRNGGFLEEDE